MSHPDFAVCPDNYYDHGLPCNETARRWNDGPQRRDSMKKSTKTRTETRTYTRWELRNRANKRGERRPIEGALAFGLLADIESAEVALREIRASRERLDALHGVALDIAPRLRNLCWAIDAANAEKEQPTA